MHKALGVFAFCTLAFSWAAPASAQTLTGEMVKLQYLVGTWNCSVTAMVPPGGTKQESGTLTFAPAPGNALSQMINTPTFSAVGFIGYDAQTKKFFQNTVNSMGGVGSQSADSGSAGHTVVFSGTATEGGQIAQSRDTDVKVSDTQISSVTEVNIGGNWTKVAEATCTKR